MKVICKSFELSKARNATQHKYLSKPPAQREGALLQSASSFRVCLKRSLDDISRGRSEPHTRPSKGINRFFSFPRSSPGPAEWRVAGKRWRGSGTCCSPAPSRPLLSRGAGPLRSFPPLGPLQLAEKAQPQVPGRPASSGGDSRLLAGAAGPRAAGGRPAVESRAHRLGVPRSPARPAVHLGPRAPGPSRGAPRSTATGPGLCSPLLRPAPPFAGSRRRPRLPLPPPSGLAAQARQREGPRAAAAHPGAPPPRPMRPPPVLTERRLAGLPSPSGDRHTPPRAQFSPYAPAGDSFRALSSHRRPRGREAKLASALPPRAWPRGVDPAVQGGESAHQGCLQSARCAPSGRALKL